MIPFFHFTQITVGTLKASYDVIGEDTESTLLGAIPGTYITDSALFFPQM